MPLLRLFAVSDGPVDRNMPVRELVSSHRWLGVAIDSPADDSVEITARMVDPSYLAAGGRIPGIAGRLEIHCFNLRSEAEAFLAGISRVALHLNTAIARSPAGPWLALVDFAMSADQSIGLVDHRFSDAPSVGKPGEVTGEARMTGAWSKSSDFTAPRGGIADGDRAAGAGPDPIAALIAKEIVRSHGAGSPVVKDLVEGLRQAMGQWVFAAISVEEVMERHGREIAAAAAGGAGQGGARIDPVRGDRISGAVRSAVGGILADIGDDSEAMAARTRLESLLLDLVDREMAIVTRETIPDLVSDPGFHEQDPIDLTDYERAFVLPRLEIPLEAARATGVKAASAKARDAPATPLPEGLAGDAGPDASGSAPEA